jgi:hypothetical protein
MTPQQYADLGKDIQAAIVTLIKGVATKAKVLDRDPVNFEESGWYGALQSGDDLDEQGKKRVHTWIITFAGSNDLESSTVRSIEPVFRYRLQVFYQHEFGKNTDNSEMRIREEVLKVQMKLAQTPKFGTGAALSYQQKHRHWPFQIGLSGFFQIQKTAHRGVGELVVELQPIVVR